MLFTRIEPAIDFDWSRKSPGGYWLDDANGGFAAWWTGTMDIERDGVYEISVRATDRVRVRIDGAAVIDRWNDDASRTSRARTTQVAWRATVGSHTIEVEHLDGSGRGLLKMTVLPSLIDGAWVRWAEDQPEA